MDVPFADYEVNTVRFCDSVLGEFMTVEELAKELSLKFYFGWMNGYNDLAECVIEPPADPEAVRKKALSCYDDFLPEAQQIIDSIKAANDSKTEVPHSNL